MGTVSIQTWTCSIAGHVIAIAQIRLGKAARKASVFEKITRTIVVVPVSYASGMRSAVTDDVLVLRTMRIIAADAALAAWVRRSAAEDNAPT